MPRTDDNRTTRSSLSLVGELAEQGDCMIEVDLRTSRGHPGLPSTFALSPSRANDFLTCPLLFRLRGIDRVVERPTSAAARGTLVHLVLERVFDAPHGSRTLEAAIDLLPSAWEQLLADDPLVAYALADDPFDPTVAPSVPDDSRDRWLRGAVPILKTYFRLEDPSRLSPTARELKLDVDAGDGMTLRGIVDRVDTAPGHGTRIVDYKTGRTPGEGYEQKAMFQMRFYALMWERVHGTVPAILQLMYLGDGQVLTYEPTTSDLAGFERKLRAMWQTILDIAAAGDWQPRESKACRTCQHHALCPAQGGASPPLPLAVDLTRR